MKKDSVIAAIVTVISLAVLYYFTFSVPYFRAKCEMENKQFWFYPRGCFGDGEEKVKESNDICGKAFGKEWQFIREDSVDKDFFVICGNGSETKHLI